MPYEPCSAHSPDREILRALAGRYMELASLPVMAERARQWTALKDLRAERPMLLFETATLEDFVAEAELQCEARLHRSVELHLRWLIRHAEEVGDDIVLEPHWPVHWQIERSDYGVPLEAEHATDVTGHDLAYVYSHPIHTPADVDRLQPRTFRVDREKTLRQAEQLADLFGDILPVVLQGTCGHLAALTQDLFKLIGNDNLLTWAYDAPQALQRVGAYLRDDRLAYYAWLERERLLGLNNRSQLGSGSPGFTTALPQPGHTGTPRLRDLWLWMESQETRMVSPGMFGEFFLPYIADVCRVFGLIYYGCCEPVHDRWELIAAAIANVRAVSISPWSDQRAMAAKLGRSYVFSRKPKPWPISGENADWEGLRQDLDETLIAARDCNLEFIYRDVYRIGGERARLRRWADLVRSRVA